MTFGVLGTHCAFQICRWLSTAPRRRQALPSPLVSWLVNFEHSHVPTVSSPTLFPYTASQSLTPQHPKCLRFGHVCGVSLFGPAWAVSQHTYISTASWPSGVVRVKIVMLSKPISSQLLCDTLSKHLKQERAAILQGQSEVSMGWRHTP